MWQTVVLQKGYVSNELPKTKSELFESGKANDLLGQAHSLIGDIAASKASGVQNVIDLVIQNHELSAKLSDLENKNKQAEGGKPLVDLPDHTPNVRSPGSGDIDPRVMGARESADQILATAARASIPPQS